MALKPLIRSATLGLALVALVALAAPSTAAAQGQDLRNPDRREAQAPQDLRNPDTRDVASIAPAPQDLRSPDARDAGEGRGAFSAPEVMVVKVPQPQPPTAPVAGGIDWVDAGIGAGGLFALIALGLGGAFAVVHRKHRLAARHSTATTV